MALDGLFGTSIDDPRTLGLLNIAANLSSNRNLVSGLSQGLLGRQQIIQGAQDAETMQKMKALQLQQAQEQMAAQQRQRDFLAGLTSPEQAAAQSALAGGGGPTVANAAKIQPVSQQQSDLFRAMQAGVIGYPEYLASLQKQKAKIKEYQNIRNPDGSVSVVGLDEYGQPVQTGLTPFKDANEVDLGGMKAFRDPITGKLVQTFNKSMTPGEAANYSLSRDRLAFDKQSQIGQITYQQDADGNFVALPTRATGGAIQAAPVFSSTGDRLQGKSAGMTEDQAKATGWLVQANNAWDNMRQVAFDKMGGLTNAARTSLWEGQLGLPEAVKNQLRSADRQRFVQASSSLAESLLRAATGAGVNESEARQKIAEITPQVGDTPENIKQKMDSIPLYLKTLEVRAGPGAKKAQSIAGGPASSVFPGVDPSAIEAELQRRMRGGN